MSTCPKGPFQARTTTPVVDPPYLYPDVGTRLRAPKRPLVPLPRSLTELTGPLLGEGRVGQLDHDLTRQHEGEPLGQRIIVHGRVLDGDGRPVPDTLVEVWQANAAGRYRHAVDQHPAPLDPNFTGVGRASPTTTAATGSSRSSPAPTRGATTQRVAPGAHPLLAVRPRVHAAARHADVLPGRSAVRAQDPIFNSIPDRARASG